MTYTYPTTRSAPVNDDRLTNELKTAASATDGFKRDGTADSIIVIATRELTKSEQDAVAAAVKNHNPADTASQAMAKAQSAAMTAFRTAAAARQAQLTYYVNLWTVLDADSRAARTRQVAYQNAMTALKTDNTLYIEFQQWAKDRFNLVDSILGTLLNLDNLLGTNQGTLLLAATQFCLHGLIGAQLAGLV